MSSAQSISPEAFARKLRPVIQQVGTDVTLAPSVKVNFDGRNLRFFHVGPDGEGLVTDQVHLSDRVTDELRTYRNHRALSGGTRSRLIGQLTQLFNKRFRGDFPFRTLVGKPHCEPATSLRAAVAIAV